MLNERIECNVATEKIDATHRCKVKDKCNVKIPWASCAKAHPKTRVLSLPETLSRSGTEKVLHECVFSPS